MKRLLRNKTFIEIISIIFGILLTIAMCTLIFILLKWLIAFIQSQVVKMKQNKLFDDTVYIDKNVVTPYDKAKWKALFQSYCDSD